MSQAWEWTDAEVAVVKELWIKGFSASRIVAGIRERCGTRRSRNAVIGWISRNKTRSGLPQQRSPDKCGSQLKINRRHEGRGGKIGAATKNARMAREKAMSGKPRNLVQPAPKPRGSKHAAIPEPLNIDLMGLTDKHCKFPVTQDVPHLFCGHPAVPGQSWCAGHVQVVYSEAVLP